MGYNNSGAIRILVDVETVALPEAADYLDLSEIQAPSNYKDPEKIKAYCENKRAELITRAALDFDLSRIVCLGWMEEQSDTAVIACGHSDDDEADMLRAFWIALDDRTTISFNGVEFDLPTLLRRSLYLGVEAPALVIDKYRTSHIDLMQRLSFNGKFKYRTLDFYCKRLKLDVPTDDTTGAEIDALVKAGEWDKVIAHNRADLFKVQALARRMGLIQRTRQPEMAR